MPGPLRDEVPELRNSARSSGLGARLGGGVRIPKALLEQAQLPEDVELEVSAEQIVIRPALRARQHWAEQFQRMAAEGDDVLLDSSANALSLWDDQAWEWE